MQAVRARREKLLFGWTLLFVLVTSVVGSTRCLATESARWLVQTNLFEAGVGGYALYRIPGLVVTAKGTVLVYCEARRSGGDWAAIDLMMRRSTDSGMTWEAARQIGNVTGPKPKNPIRKNPNPTEVTYNNPLAIAESDGTVHFLFCLEYMRCFDQVSKDDGQTWSTPVEITKSLEPFRPAYDWKVVATGPGHGIELRDHRLVAPIWLSLGKGSNNHTPSVSSAIFSDDHGESWSTSDIAIPGSAAITNANECAVVELSNGDVMLNARNHSPEQRRAIAISADRAKHWSMPHLQSDLPEPICMAGLVRYSVPGKTNQSCLLLSQPAPVEIPSGKSGKRENLTIRLSRDDGKTWPGSKTLELGPSAYSDLAIMRDGTVGCFYERSKGTASPYGYLTFVRFNFDWLTNGQQIEPVPGK